VLVDFIFENGLVALGRKKFVWLIALGWRSLLGKKKKGRLAHRWWYPFKKKLNAHGCEKALKFGGVEIDFRWRSNIWRKTKCLPRFRIFGEASSVYPIFPFFTRMENCFIIFFYFGPKKENYYIYLRLTQKNNQTYLGIFCYI
jgi:hypothetical protein